ncbi:gluconate 5-dehydrogenase [Ahrensia sp. R2A130]|nr:gluconate 5-dehydrogenase [Ahrensia sp. R2A130]
MRLRREPLLLRSGRRRKRFHIELSAVFWSGKAMAGLMPDKRWLCKQKAVSGNVHPPHAALFIWTADNWSDNPQRYQDNLDPTGNTPMPSPSPLFDLTGKTALITGSSLGIGRGLSKGLQEAGATIIVNGRNAERLTTAAEELRADGATVHELPFDVTDHAAAQAAVDGFEAEHGAIDILINNAGMQHRGPLEEFDAAAFANIVTTNITSVFNVGQAVARHMIKRGEGKIINISSVQSALARPGIAPYTATKGAVTNLTKGMATDWAKYGLQCNAIAPGYYDTPLNKALVDDPEFTAWLEKRTPAGRWGEIPELVGAAVFLSSAASSFVNGHTLFVDGGITVSL